MVTSMERGNKNNMRKDGLLAVLSIIGSFIAGLFGGWDTGLETLLLFMAVDYVTGVIVAAFFKKSGKSKSGALDSKAGWLGLMRKVSTLFMVLVAYRLDMLVGTNYIRDLVIIGFCANELLSIIENCGKMNLPLPPVLIKAVETLQSKGDKGEKKDETNHGQAG